MNLIDLAMVSLVAAMAALLAIAVGHTSRRLALGVIGALALWLLFTAALSMKGFLSVWTLPPRLLLLPLAALLTMVLLSRTATVGGLIQRIPRSWPIAAQAFRVPVELILYALHVSGRAPVQVTFEGRNFDILVGLTAPVAAWLVVRRMASPAAVLVWNLAGLAVLANTIGTVATSMPGPLHLAWPGGPFTALAEWPLVWLPAFLAPLAVMLHIFSLRQTLPLLRVASESQPI